MDATTSPSPSPSPSETITCAHPRCDAVTTLAESCYIDGCGQVCPDCAGPGSDLGDDFEPPY
jgi:hypothetical protein